VTWRNATLKVGRGLIEGENQLDALLLQSSHVIDVRGIGIMTSHGSNGQWLVYKDGKYNIIIISLKTNIIFLSFYQNNKTR
jgi:hypothetical protein